jgi:phenylalanyl-tRNA synthetase alpha chain
MQDLKRIERTALSRAARARTTQDVVQLRAEILGKKGAVGQLLQGLRDLPAEERPKVGQLVNETKAKVEAALAEAQVRIDSQSAEAELTAGRFDVTLPGRRVVPGAPHPLRLIEEEAIRSFTALGFTVAQGPLVEHDWYNFEALNIPEDHPARDMQDTFFLAPRVVLRTHTSNVQIRTMVKRKPPVRIIAPGMVFRHDEVDPTHSPVFHQIEGLWVDDRVTFADLRGVLHRFAEHMFGPGARVRFRPSFFPFTEPSAEVDISCVACGGSGVTPGGESCRVCKGTGWLEVLGSGMVDPAVLEAVGYDAEQVQGFAFGLGIERVAMLRYGVDDMRLFYENDLRFLQQFR